jgi:DNA polymerase I-like protein with 3'-5' exonuclease and polymerase domains
LGAVLERHLGVKLAKAEGGTDWGAMFLTDAQTAYAENDVRYLHRLRDVLSDKIQKAGLARIFELETALIPIVVAMEQHGFAIDSESMNSLLAEAERGSVKLTTLLREKFGDPQLNLDSPEQMLEAFRSAGVQIDSTGEEVLAALSHELAPVVLEYREKTKLASTIKGLLKHWQADNRIHARFNPLGSVAGRFSSSGPNLQNVTRGALRSCFIPSGPDRKLIVADYNQIELRIAAHFAGDAVMLEAFRRREDLHRKTAAAVLSKTSEEVTGADRQLAKAVNFGFLYGQGAKGFRVYARTDYGIILTLEEAQRFREEFFHQYPGLGQWHAEAWHQAEDGICEARTVLGRLLWPTKDELWQRFNMLTNFRVQGSAADVLKAAMVKLSGVLPADARLVATVHDEILYDVPSKDADHLCCVVRYAMEDAFTEIFGKDLPIKVEAKVCSNWAEK